VSEDAEAGKLDVGGVIRDVWRLYRAHWLLLTLIAVAVLIPQSLLDEAFGEIEIHRVHSISDVGKLLSIPLAVVFNMGGEAFYSGIVAAVTLHWRAGVARPRLGRVAARIPYLTLIALDITVAVGTALGLLFLIVPGVLIGTYTFAAPALAEVRDLGFRAALRESFEIVRGNFWRVLAIGAVAILGTAIVGELIAMPFDGFAAGAAAHLFSEALVEPLQGAAAVITALALLDLHGREPVPVRPAEIRP
jgi:hypothetical protein